MNEAVLLRMIEKLVVCLTTHIHDEAAKSGVKDVRLYCPCWDQEIAEAERLLKEAKWKSTRRETPPAAGR